MQYTHEKPLELNFGPDATLYDLQSSLLDVWTKVKVDDYYQNIILQHLDTLPLTQAEKQIAKQIKSINEGSSSYFKLAQTQTERKKALQMLNSLVDHQNNKDQVDEQSLREICQQISSLRDNNLGFAESLIHLYQQMTQKQCVVSDQCMQMLKSMDDDNQFLKQSFLKDFIMFQKGYDPFFTYHYDVQNKKQPTKSSPVVDQLFTLSLSYACRLFKAKNQLIDIITHKKIGRSVTQNQYHSPMKRIRKIRLESSNQTPDGENNYERQFRSSSMHFTRRLPSRNRQQKSRQGSYNTINIQATPNSRKTSSMMKYSSGIDEETLRPRRGLPNLRVNKQMETITPNEPTQDRYRTQGSDDIRGGNHYRITNKKVIKRTQDETQNCNTVFEDQDGSLPQRRCNYKYQKQLHPLIRIKKEQKRSDEGSKGSNKEADMKDSIVQTNYKRPKLSIRKESPEAGERRTYEPNSPISPVRIKTETQLQDSQYQHGNKSIKTSTQKHSSQPSRISVRKAPSPDLPPLRAQSPPSNLMKLQQIKKSKDKNVEDMQNSISNSTITVESSSLKHPVKIRAGKYTYQEIINLIRTANFIPSVKETISAARWQQSLKKFQGYVTEFVSGNQILIIAIALFVPDGNYLIKLWGVLNDCPQNISLSLFQKYIQYLEKMTSLNNLYYNGPATEEIKASGFSEPKPKAFVRTRKLPKRNKQFQNPQFLSLKCSNIIIDQQTISASLLISEEIQKFSSLSCYQLPSMISMDKQRINENLQMHLKIGEHINDMETLNQLLTDQNLDTYEVSKEMNIRDVKALRLNMNTMFKVPFVAHDNVIKFQGSLVSKTQKTTICLLSCSQYNIRVFFGLGFPNITKFISSIKIDKVEPCEFSVHMFQKQLYGRLETSTPVDGCYGNWEVTMSYEEELPGVLRHDFKSGLFFGEESFRVAIEIEGEMAYGFEVLPDDFSLTQ